MSRSDERPRPVAGGVRPWPPESLDDELATIDLATAFFREPGALHDAVFSQYGIRGTRFWQVVNQLIDRPDIIAVRAAACRRLHTQRSRRSDIRAKARAQIGKRRPWAQPWFATTRTAAPTLSGTADKA